MKLKITAIRERGDLNKERLVMKAEAGTDIGQYVLLRVDTAQGKPTTAVRNAYWFPDKAINPGDFIVVYSKEGKSSEKAFRDVVSHFFYWGSKTPLWQEADVGATVLHAPDWESFVPSDG